mgnify:CR=1 FL=1
MKVEQKNATTVRKIDAWRDILLSEFNLYERTVLFLGLSLGRAFRKDANGWPVTDSYYLRIERFTRHVYEQFSRPQEG